MMIVVALIGAVLLIGWPKVANGLAKTNLRSSRITVANMFAKARAFALATGGSLELKTQVEAVERHAIQRALEASGGNRRQAASLLGISLRTLFYKMRRLPLH
jgi:transcriptional regulator with PAS, ATPase and Fis domain